MEGTVVSIISESNRRVVIDDGNIASEDIIATRTGFPGKRKRTVFISLLVVVMLALVSTAAMSLATSAPGDLLAETSDTTWDAVVRVGWLNDIVVWNPMNLAMVEDWVACSLMYSPLFTYDSDWNMLEGDLARSWSYEIMDNGTLDDTSDDYLVASIEITQNAYWRSLANLGDTSNPVTAEDVKFTLDMIIDEDAGRFPPYLKGITEIRVIDDHNLELETSYLKATIFNDLSGIPIVPKYLWESYALNPCTMTMQPEQLVGCGPFVFDSMLPSSWYMFVKAPNYHGEADFGEERDIDIDGILFTLHINQIELVIAMNTGSIDATALTGYVGLFTDLLGVGTDEPIVKSAVQELGICDIALNAIPVEFRNPGPGGSEYCDGNLHLLDSEVRKAILMTLNKQYISETIMGGLVTEATSVIWPGDWQADIEGVLPFDPDGARQVLLDAGYIDDGGDFLKAGPTSYVVTEGLIDITDTAALRLSGIRCHAPITDLSYVQIAMAWAGWAAGAGIGFEAGGVNEAQMINEEWYKALFDIWVWHWGWGPEPLSDLSVWLTSEIHAGGDNCEMPMGPWWVHSGNYTESPYVNASMIEEFGMDDDGFIGFSAYDQNFSLAQRTIDLGERQVLVNKLQQWIYDSYTETPPYYDVGLYGFSTERFQGWGNWELHPGNAFTSSLPWLWFDLEPTGVPMFDTGLAASYEAQQDDPTSFSVMMHDSDGDSLDVTWNFGDGSPEEIHIYTTGTAASFEASVTHTYTTLATGLTLTVTVSDGTYTIEDSASVDVVAVADEIPEISNPSHSPPVAYIGDTTTWSITASDAEATELTVTWDWDDGSFTSTPITIGTPGTPVTDEQTHVFDNTGNYRVTVYVDDGSPLGGHNNSLVVAPAYSVIANSPPSAGFEIIPQEGTVDTIFIFDASSSSDLEDDPESLLVRWDWESDGEWDTDYSTDKFAEHQFSVPGVYAVRLEVKDSDDLTNWAQWEVTVLSSPILTPHDPIYIYGDLDFATTAEAESWAGDGTEGNPYIIELLEITGGGTGTLIRVWDTTVHFVIRDCQLSGGPTYGSAIHLFNVDHASVHNNVFTSCPSYSIYYEQSESISIQDNTVIGGSQCIGMIRCENAFVGGNTVHDAERYPLCIESSHDVTLRENRFDGSDIKIGGYLVSHWNTHDIDDSNTVNDGPVYYIKDRDGGSVPSEAGQIILANCMGMIVECDAKGGISLGFSSDNTIMGSVATSVHFGIFLAYSPRNTVMSTSVYDCTYGINVLNSPDCVIEDSIFTGCGYGIYSQLSNGLSVLSNSVLDSDWSGIFLYHSSFCEVRHNLIARGLQEGLNLADADSNLIASNDFIDNTIQATEGADSTGNAWDDGYPSGGNYWSDYQGVDDCSGVDQTDPGFDGIGDTPYVLTSGSQDNYPLMEPFNSPAPLPPVADFTVTPELGYLGTAFTVNASSSYDFEDPLEALEVRWDWSNDGAWDTKWTTDKTACLWIFVAGEHTIVVEVRDSDGMTDTESHTVEVFDHSFEQGEFPERLFTIVNSGGREGRVEYVSWMRPQDDFDWWLELTHSDGSGVKVSIYEGDFLNNATLMSRSHVAAVGDESEHVSLRAGTVYWVVIQYLGPTGIAELTEHAVPISPTP